LLSLCIYQLFSKWHSYRIKKTRRCHSVGYSLKPFIGANLPSWKSQKDPKLEVGQLSKRQLTSGKASPPQAKKIRAVQVPVPLGLPFFFADRNTDINNKG
jgi:hypothetical protein